MLAFSKAYKIFAERVRRLIVSFYRAALFFGVKLALVVCFGRAARLLRAEWCSAKFLLSPHQQSGAPNGSVRVNYSTCYMLPADR